MVAGHLRIQNGIYQMILSYYDKSKKRKTKSVSTKLPVKGNKKRAELMLIALRKEFIPTLWNKDTLMHSFLDEWLEVATLSPEIYAEYRMCFNSNILPYLENSEISIANIAESDLNAFYKNIRQTGSAHMTKALKETILTCHSIICGGLNYALSSGWIENNPAEKIDPLTGEIEILFADFILDWLDMMKSSIDITTYAGYASVIKKRISPYFSEKGYTLNDLEANPKYIQDYYQYELEECGVSTNTVIHRHANIRKCLQYAFQIGLIKSNPADRIQRPQKNVYVPKYYNGAELETLFTCAKGDPIELTILIAAFYGLRRSEIVGLKWKYIDFEQKTITIKHVVTDVYLDGKMYTVEKDKTKTKKSTRTLPLVEPIEKALIALKRQQTEDMAICGASYCKTYLKYILRNKVGERIKPGFVSQHYALILRKNNLRSIRFHDLRHSCASLLYASGVDLKSIQEWLGHSTITTSANIYTHFDFSKKVESANAIIGILPV